MEKAETVCETCGTELTLCYEWDHSGLRGDVLKCLKCAQKVKPKDCNEPFTQEFILVYGSDNKKPTKNNCCSCYWIRCPIKRVVCRSGPMAENAIRVGLKCRSFQRRG